MGLYQRYAEEGGPLLDEIPDVTIGELSVICSVGEFAGFTNFIQHTQHDHGGLWTAGHVEAPDRFDFNMQHRGPRLMK
jgi:hypothetical protein